MNKTLTYTSTSYNGAYVSLRTAFSIARTLFHSYSTLICALIDTREGGFGPTVRDGCDDRDSPKPEEKGRWDPSTFHQNETAPPARGRAPPRGRPAQQRTPFFQICPNIAAPVHRGDGWDFLVLLFVFGGNTHPGRNVRRTLF